MKDIYPDVDWYSREHLDSIRKFLNECVARQFEIIQQLRAELEKKDK